MDATKPEEQKLELYDSTGVAEWHRRRAAGEQVPMRLVVQPPFNSTVDLDLRGIDFGGVSLVGSDLSRADLTGAHMYRADLSHVRLSGAKLRGAQLFEAVLADTDLHGASFADADLREAILCRARGEARFTRARLDRADLTWTSLDGSDFSGAKLVDAVLGRASLMGSHFVAADLRRADLTRAQMSQSSHGRTRLDRADLSGANLQGAYLSDASLIGANLGDSDLSGANLTGAVLEESRMIGTRLERTILNECSVYGVSAWDLLTDDETRQRSLNIGRHGEASITVDDLEVAQFMYLLMNNARLRGVIDTITSKVVLILGRFTSERKAVLDALRDTLRGDEFDFVPIVFDFDKPFSRTTAETIATLAGMARFVIADLTEAKSVLQELREIVPSSPSLPVLPILLDGHGEPGMLDSFRPYPWFLKTQVYADEGDLLERLGNVIRPAVKLSRVVRGEDDQESRTVHDD